MSMSNTLDTLRKAGFFKELSCSSNDEILDKIYKQRRKFYSKVFGYDYDPERDLNDQELARQDTKKMFYLDLEAGVLPENKVYICLLKALDEISGRENLITEIDEEWKGENGPIIISCRINGEPRQFNPEYCNDWIDQKLIDHILLEISYLTQEQFHLCLGPNLEWLGQDVNYMRLTWDERKILEEGLSWSFFDDFIKESKIEP